MKREWLILQTKTFIKDIEHYELDKIGFIHDTRRKTDFIFQCIPHNRFQRSCARQGVYREKENISSILRQPRYHL